MNFRILVSILISGCILAISPALANNDSQQHFQSAQKYMNTREWGYASFEWRKLIALDPKNVRAHVGLSYSLLKADALQEAIMHLEEARTSIQDPAIETALARAYELNDQHGKAIELYTQLLKNKDPNPVAFKGLKRILRRQPQDIQQAIKAQLKTIAKNAAKQAQVLFKNGNYRAAVPYYEIAASQWPKAGRINDYAVAQFLAGDSPNALKNFDLIRKTKDHWRVEANYGLAALSLGKSHAGKYAIENAIAMCKDSKKKAQLYNVLGYAYEQAKKPLKAKYSYEKAVELDPLLLKARKNLAYIYQSTQDYEQAVNTYRSILRDNPKNAEVLTLLGFTYDIWDKPKHAIRYYQNALRADPAYTESYYHLATLYKKIGKLEKSNTYYKKLSELEFATMESEKKAGSKQTVKKPAPLFQYIDVFLSMETKE